MGWLMARVDMKTVLKQAKTVPIRFYKSLDAMIDNRTKNAADILSEIIEDQHERGQQIESYELAFTLGKLFRKRGENDKAITLHQKLLTLPDIPQKKRQQIQFELGQDYRAAGLVDRAEKQFENLLNSDFKNEASRILLSIYQQDQEWEKTIALASKLPTEDASQLFDLAEFHCEIAQRALIEMDLTKAQNEANTALSIHGKCTRANIILGDIAMKEHNYRQAIAAYTAIEKQNYQFLGRVGEKIYDAYEELGKSEEGLNLLIGYMETFPTLDFTNLIYEKALILFGQEKANEISENLIRLNPNMQKLGLFSDIIASRHPAFHSDANLFKKVFAEQISKSLLYQCQHCHFKSQVFFWHCPACDKWETFTPNRIET